MFTVTVYIPNFTTVEITILSNEKKSVRLCTECKF